MCGIVGWMGAAPTSIGGASPLAAMCDTIRHRGPDDQGGYVAPGIALGMRRLSVIDVAGGRQPVANEDATVHAVFNGEIYNFRQLRRQLERGGHRITSLGDSEPLVHLYEDAGAGFVDALRGMFALAIWDTRLGRLLLARDRLGIKPLYYWTSPERIVFASELRAFLELREFAGALDRQAIGQYLTLGYVADPLAIFRNVRKLAPGHVLTRDRDGHIEVRCYWSPVSIEQHQVSEEESIEELRRLLNDSVACHLESDVPLGAFLSGGLDSSTVVACMSRRMDRPVRTFSIGFAEPDFNEAPYAAAVAQALRTKHTELIVHHHVDALFEDVVRGFDEPFGDSSAVPTFLVSRLAREQVTVALSGDGGDELFGGYTRYAEILRRHELKPPALRALVGFVGHLLPHGTRGRNRLLDLGRTRMGRYAATVAAPPAVADGGLVLADIAEEIGSLDTLLDGWFAGTAQRDFITRMMLVDVQSYLPGDILTKVDRMSMAVSLEARVPLLDHHVVEFALSLPAHLTMRDGKGKWLLRKAIDGLVPRELLDRPKQGFGLPLRHWFRGPLRHRLDTLLLKESPIYEFVDAPAARRIIAEHRGGRRDHSLLIWRLLVLDVWLRLLERGELARTLRMEYAPLVDARVYG